MLLKHGYYYLTVKRCMYMETIGLFPILVSSSKAKHRRKQEESVQRFNRISCTGRATPRPQLSLPSSLSLSFPPSPSVSLFLCYWILVSLPERGECVGLVNGITGNIWKYRWPFMIDRIVGFQNNFNRWKGAFLPIGCVSLRLSTGQSCYSKSIRDYCHCSVQFHKLWLVASKTILKIA